MLLNITELKMFSRKFKKKKRKEANNVHEKYKIKHFSELSEEFFDFVKSEKMDKKGELEENGFCQRNL